MDQEGTKIFRKDLSTVHPRSGDGQPWGPSSADTRGRHLLRTEGPGDSPALCSGRRLQNPCVRRVLFSVFKAFLDRGAWAARSVKHPTLGFHSDHGLEVCEFAPHVGLCAASTERLGLLPRPRPPPLPCLRAWGHTHRQERVTPVHVHGVQRRKNLVNSCSRYICGHCIST